MGEVCLDNRTWWLGAIAGGLDNRNKRVTINGEVAKDG